jgi:type IV secretory pathway TraG/TraD family ATPase VirD4
MMIDQITSPLLDPFVLIAGFALALMGYTAIKHRPNESGTLKEFGTAGWGDKSEYKNLTTKSSAHLEIGSIMIGPAPWCESERIDLPLDLANRNTLILGPNGSGKSRGFFLWNCAHYKGSFIASDPKNELWKYTSGFHSNPRRYAPRDPDNSEPFNWIPLCGKDANLCLKLSRAVTRNEDSGHGNPFYVRADTALLAALFAHASSFTEPTPAACYDFLTSHSGDDDTLAEALLNSPNAIARQFASIFSQGKADLRGNIAIGVGLNLVWLSDEKVRRFTSSVINPPDFLNIRTNPTSIYWCLEEGDTDILQQLSTIFFTLCIDQIKRATGDIPVALLFDEFANIGRIPNVNVEFAVLRGRGVGIHIGLQALAQLEKEYGHAVSEIILSTCNTKIVLAGLDPTSAEYVSTALGITTVSEDRLSTSTVGSFLGRRTTTRSKAVHQRPLLTADEIRRIGDRQQVFISTNKKPLLMDRFWYSAQPATARSKLLGAVRTQTFNLKRKKLKTKEGDPPHPPNC